MTPKVSGFAESLRCPGCGARNPPDRHACGHCQTALAQIACPRCFGRVFQGSNHCPHCGSSLREPGRAQTSATSRCCPRCLPKARRPLSARLVSDSLLDECPGCGGAWLERATFERIVEDRERQAKILAEGGPVLDLGAPRTDASDPDRDPRYLPCPECQQLMLRKNFARTSGVILDVCTPHGFWFDRDELGRVVQFVMSGRLQAARVQQLEEVGRELERRKRELADAGMSVPLAGRSEVSVLPDLLGLLWELLDF